MEPCAELAADETLLCTEDRLVCADDRLLATEDKLLSTEAMLLDAGEARVVVVLLCRFARERRLVASGGFSEWTCSIALRSLLKTPCLNLGANLWRMEWMELSSTLSTNLWNKSQSATESEYCVVGFPRDVRSSVLSTRACRGKIIVASVCKGWADGR